MSEFNTFSYNTHGYSNTLLVIQTRGTAKCFSVFNPLGFFLHFQLTNFTCIYIFTVSVSLCTQTDQMAKIHDHGGNRRLLETPLILTLVRKSQRSKKSVVLIDVDEV